MLIRNFSLFFFAFALSLAIISCSDEEGVTNPPSNTSNAPLAKFSDIQVNVFNNCLGAQCHSSAGNQGGLTLEAGVAYNNLVGVQSVLFPQFKRVEAGNSSNSLIIKILKGDVNPRMPLNGSPLSIATIDSIAKWIDQGALNN